MKYRAPHLALADSAALLIVSSISGQPESALRYTMKRAASRQPADLANARQASG